MSASEDCGILETCRGEDSQHLRAEIARLSKELEGLKENKIVESMQDMRHTYVQLRAKYKAMCSLVSCNCAMRKLTVKNRKLVKTLIGFEASSKLLLEEVVRLSDAFCKPFDAVDAAEWKVTQESGLHVHHVIVHIISLCEKLDGFDDDLKVQCVCDDMRRGTAALLHDDEDFNHLDSTDETSSDSDGD
ncbi:hypothetical protein HK104_004968 [Borealophlyctis nickersoniae]|nr:hypothetical protein HK104_004968 [Borealophlyctis nickersoniae]